LLQFNTLIINDIELYGLDLFYESQCIVIDSVILVVLAGNSDKSEIQQFFLLELQFWENYRFHLLSKLGTGVQKFNPEHHTWRKPMHYVIHELIRHRVTQKLIVTIFSGEKSLTVIHKYWVHALL
jgi:hypothetical protein